MLKANNLTHRNDPVIIQSFETANLRKLNGMIDVKLAQLLDAPTWPPPPAWPGSPSTPTASARTRT